MFEKALGFFGLQKKEKGHILGDGDRRKGGVNNGSNYDVVFESASSLGLEFGEISIDKSTNEIVVVDIVPDSSAAKSGIFCGDVVVSVEGNMVTSLDSLLSVLKALPSPFTITFSRRIIQQIGDKTNSLKTSTREQLSDEVKIARREQMVQAAAQRENNWSNKIKSKNIKNPKYPSDSVRGDDVDNINHSIETKMAINEIKKQEQLEIQKLGYDPYQPVLSSANIALSVNNGIGGNESPSHGTSIAATSESLDHDVISRAEKHFEDISNEFDDHIAIILSLSPPIPAVTIDTAMKILSSIQSNPEEEKYRCIRCSNAKFHSKLGSIPHGIDLLLSCGFSLEERSSSNKDNNPLLESYLVHDGSELQLLKVKYGYLRLLAAKQLN